MKTKLNRSPASDLLTIRAVTANDPASRASLEQLRQAAPGLEAWLRVVFTVMGGFMAGSGVLTLFLARRAVPLRLRGTGWAVALAGLLTVVLMCAMNFVLDSDFRWLLLLPALLWAAAVFAYTRPA
ncbi:MAG: hypothetical protein ACOY95_17295 [Pseudomonadota bacterium]|jgi:hypothetical protein